MLITKLKPKSDILPLPGASTVVVICEGCNEVCFPKAEATELRKLLSESGESLIEITTDYICNPDHLKLQVEGHLEKIGTADSVLVLSCGVGVQIVADMFSGIPVFAACDTYPLPGHQGVTPLLHDCANCGECNLNNTGGICPVTSCSKSLLNGQCGGAKHGKCEVDNDMECGWERIYKRLEELRLLDNLNHPVKVKNFAGLE